MADDRLTTSLQESVLTLLATNDTHGRIASGLITAKSFDTNYQEFADRVISYQHKHKRSPGLAHLDDIVDDILSNPNHKLHKQYVRILDNISAQAQGLNSEYILKRLQEFERRQTLKGAVIEAASRYQQNDQTIIKDVEEILYKALKARETDLSAGTFLSDPAKSLRFLELTNAAYKTGIPELDRLNVGPTPGEMLLFIAPKGAGKSWFCIDMGKKMLMQGGRVLHISLEMSEARVAQRYFQNFFAFGKRSDPFNVSEFITKQGNLTDLRFTERKAAMSLSNPKIERYLRTRIKEWGGRFRNLVIKSFPAKSLTIAKLNAYLDFLELTEGFIPTGIIVDYPDLMWMDLRDLRISVGWTYESLRGIAQERYMAMLAVSQTNRIGWDAVTVKGSMIGEDATKLMSADQALIYSRTKLEKERNLARLLLEKNRNDEDGFTTLISQSYHTGQFVLDSVRMGSEKAYFEMLAPTDEAGEGEE